MTWQQAQQAYLTPFCHYLNISQLLYDLQKVRPFTEKLNIHLVAERVRFKETTPFQPFPFQKLFVFYIDIL